MTPTFSRGDTLLGRDWFNGLVARARRQRSRSIGPGLEMRPNGLSRQCSPEIWAKITSSYISGMEALYYGFQEVVPNASGGFDLLTGGRTDAGGLQPAYEVNGVMGLGGTYQRIKFSTANDWRFQAVRAGGSAGSGVPPCGCPGMTDDPLTYSLAYYPTTIGETGTKNISGSMSFGAIAPDPRVLSAPPADFRSDWAPRPADFWFQAPLTPDAYAPFYRLVRISCGYYIEFADSADGTVNNLAGVGSSYGPTAMLCYSDYGIDFPHSTIMTECDPYYYIWDNTPCGGGNSSHFIIGGMITQ